MTTTVQARDLINGNILAAWRVLGFDDANLIWTDIPGKIPASELVWARVTLKHATGTQTTLSGRVGGRQFEQKGTVTIQVFAPVGDGSTAGYSTAQALKTVLENPNVSDIWYRNARLLEIGRSGAFEQINVLADFSYTDVK